MASKYARTEHERRFLVAGLPARVDAEAYDRLEDRYLAGTHLRLRVVRGPAGEWRTTKLGHKIADPAAPGEARLRRMTTIYLPEGEGAVLAALDGVPTVKRRYRLDEGGVTFSID